MADEEKRDGANEHCTFGGGIPDGVPPNGELPPEYQGGPGSFWEKADLSSKLYNPDEIVPGVYGLVYRTPINGENTYYGEWGYNDGKIFVRSPMDGVLQFNNEGELGEFLKSRGVMMDNLSTSDVPKAVLDKELKKQQDRETGGFPTEGFYAAASPAMKMVMRNLTRFTGNGWETMRTYASAAHANDLFFQEAHLNMFQRFRALSADEFDKAMSRVPTPLFEKTLAGRLLQKKLWLQNSLYDRDAVLNNISRALNLPSYAEKLEEYRNRIQAVASGLTSPQYRTYQALLEAGKKFGYTMDDINMYRLAKHVTERARLAKANAKELADELRIHEDDIYNFFPHLKNPTAFPRFNKETGQLDRENVAPRSMDEVEADAKAYLDSIPEDKSRHLDTANSQLTREYINAIDSMLENGFIGKQRHSLFSASPNYVPLREADALEGIRPLTDSPITGRSTEANNPTSQLLGFIEGVHRRNAQNRVNSLIYRWAVDASNVGYVKINRETMKETTSVGENGKTTNSFRRDTFQKNNDIFVHFPNPDGKGEPIVMRVSFDTSHPLGKMLAKSYLPPEQRGRMFETLAGFTRFASILMTNATPAWALKSTAWNLGVTPFSVQSAFNMSTRDAGRFILPYLRNVARVYRDMWNPRADHLSDPAIRWLYENGAGTLNDERYQPGRAAAHADFRMQGIGDQLRSDPLNFLREGGRAAWRGALHISHTPDIAFQLGAAKTYIEMHAGRSFKNYDELASFMEENPTVAQQALSGSRRILPNFTRRGNMTTLSSFFPFFNASAQTLPFMKQVASSPTGLMGAGLGIILGYATLELAHEELGEKGDYLKNTDANVYLGHGIQLPMDYAYHLPLQIGNQLWKMVNNKTDMPSALGAIGHSVLESISPIGAPQEGQSPTNWALYGMAPYFVRPAIVGLSGIDQYGNNVDADTVVDAQSGRRIMNPHAYQLARPNTPAWADGISKAIYNVFGDMSIASPGRIAGMTSQILPIVPHMMDVLGGTTQARQGEVPSAAGGAADLFAPSFQAQTDLFGARSEFEEKRARAMAHVSNPAGLPLTEQNLLTSLGPKANQIQVATNNAAHEARRVRVDGFTLPQIRAKLIAARQGGSHADAVKYAQMLNEGQQKLFEIYQRHTKDIPND